MISECISIASQWRHQGGHDDAVTISIIFLGGGLKYHFEPIDNSQQYHIVFYLFYCLQ